MSKKRFHCKSAAQLKAIRHSYWLKAQQRKKEETAQRERHTAVMRQDYPQDFYDDDFLDAIEDCAYHKPQVSDGVKTLGVKGKPIGVIPYDLGKVKCDYAEALKAQDIAQGKSVRPDKYYHDKAWKALDMDAKLRERGFK